MKRIALLLVLMIILSSADSCSDQAAQTEAPGAAEAAPSAESGGGGKATAPGQLPIVTEPVKITIGKPANITITDYDDNWLTNQIREISGIDIEIVLFDSSEALTQLQLMVSSGEELPDILNGFGLTPEAREQYGKDGVIIPLNDYFNRETGLASFFWESLAKCTVDQQESIFPIGTSTDGNLYVFPSGSFSLGDAYAEGFHVNAAFLDSLGMEAPETTEEFYDYLVAVRDLDPNGNGTADEIPLIGSTDAYAGSVANPIICAFTYYPSTQSATKLCVTNDGELYLPWTLPEFQDALEYLNRLYSEKLISDLSFSAERVEPGLMDLPAGESIVGMVAGSTWGMFADPANNMNIHNYIPLGALEGPNGVHTSPSRAITGSYNNFITSDCENPDVAFRLLDMMAREDMYFKTRWGEEGIDWRWPTDEEISKYKTMYGRDLVILRSLRGSRPGHWGAENNIIWNDLSMLLIPHYLSTNSISENLITDESELTEAERLYNVRVANDAKAFEDKISEAPDILVGTLLYTEGEADSLGTLYTDLSTYAAESITRFVIGEFDPIADWDTFQAELENIGIARYLEISQAAYDRMTGR